MELILFIIITLYFIEHAVLFTGLLKNLDRSSLTFNNPHDFPSVSIIVAAKNEEFNIGSCINSLLKLVYPDDKLEIIVINDNSADKTKEIIQSYNRGDRRIKYLETKGRIGPLKGKANALAQAIKESKGEIIFTTDADSEVKPTWVKETIKYFDEKTGVVCGYSLMKPKNLFWGIQSFDWLYLLTLCSGADGINKQLSCVGNNMSYRRKTYEEVGGYENIEFSVTEDFKLLHTIKDKTNWGMKFPVNSETLNDTVPCLTYKELYQQKKRWGIGGLDIGIPGYFVGLMGWLTGAMILFSWFFVGIEVYLFLLILKLMIDFLFTFPVIKKFNFYGILKYFISFEIYFALYSLLLPFILILSRRVVWKEQKL
ncbi:MAG: glycosyltransferase [Ignavibacteria bacterium]